MRAQPAAGSHVRGAGVRNIRSGSRSVPRLRGARPKTRVFLDGKKNHTRNEHRPTQIRATGIGRNVISRSAARDFRTIPPARPEITSSRLLRSAELTMPAVGIATRRRVHAKMKTTKRYRFPRPNHINRSDKRREPFQPVRSQRNPKLFTEQS